MSHHPPPSFGDPNHTQSWPPSYSSMIPPNFPSNPDFSTGAQQVAGHPNQHYPLNLATFNVNSQIPGPAGPGAPGFYFPPLPYMSQLDGSGFPPSSFPPLPVPPGFGYPPVPPPGSSNPLSAPMNPHGTVPSQQSGSEPQRNAVTNAAPLHREEGEVSEDDEPYSPPASNVQIPQHPSDRHSELEEGETRSKSCSSNKSSSPYNPPMSVSADVDVVDRAIKMQKGEPTTSTSEDQQSPRTAIQLRVQAQGALLSLAPHNIRYRELVAEGINPAILKQLYDEVGLKIDPPPNKPPPSTPAATKPGHGPANQRTVQSKPLAKQTETPTQPANMGSTQKPSFQKPTSPTTKPPAESGPNKPMERKEVIARMLAAKAAKPSEPTTPKTPPKNIQAPADRSTTTTAAPSSGGDQGKENGVPVREKNKAQTELARQRIEELKRQALLKSQQKAQQSNQTGPNPAPSEVPPDPLAPAVQHPLPVRPPLPQRSASSTIPGLFMTESTHDSEVQSSPEIAQGITVDPTPLSRPSQRKRPRAADFDGPPSGPKRQFSHGSGHPETTEKLIIDISDDESLYGDDEGENMDLDSGPDQEPESTIAIGDARLQIQTDPSTTRASTSTPQGLSRPSDNDHIRQRDLAIQAMHRKIAELEQRRKAKLAASRTGSPRTMDESSTSSSAAQLSPIDTAETSSGPASGSKLAQDTSTTMTSFTERPSLIDSFSDSSLPVLASMDIAQLDSIRPKILRLKEIEADLRGLDADDMSSESRMDACEQEANRLLNEITSGKEDYVQLVEELKNLSKDINDLSLQDLNELHRQAETKKQQQTVANEVSSRGQPSASEEEDSIMTDASAPVEEPLADAPAASESGLDSHAIVAPPTPSQSESLGSAMDESVDSSSSSDESSRVENPSMPVLETPLDHAPETGEAQPPPESDSSLKETDSGSAVDESLQGVSSSEGSSSEQESASEQPLSGADANSIPATEQVSVDDLEHPLPERPPLAVTEEIVPVDKADATGHHLEGAHREPSPESDAYEPPEPDNGADSDPDYNPPSADYSPPFSPAPPGPVEETGTSVPSSGLPVPGQTLTRAPQASVVESQRDRPIGVVGDEAPSTNTEPGFTSYVSPLRHFKAYRYHPTYPEDVSGGYRSLTYSHDIDLMKSLCPYELAGGVCNDRSCDFQHFRDINISDDKILIQMGAVREGQTDEERETYLLGLKEIINEMRRDKVKDFSTVANEIAAYRRRFLQDPSRVLPL